MPDTPSTEYAGELPHKTFSVCPECHRVLPATVFEKDGKVYITRTCPEHGEITEIYYEDAYLYKRFRKLAYLKRFSDPSTFSWKRTTGANCPFDCGLCPRHRSNTVLLNIVLTNRCDLACWYCFFYAREGQPIYEPTPEQVRQMLHNARKQGPVPPTAVQYTGGEPTIRDDLPELIRIAKEEGYTHVQINTNGIRLSRDPNYAAKLKEAGASVYYLSFDGVDGETNWKNHWEIPFVLKNLRNVGGPGVVLVPTVIRDVNTHQLGDILNFGLNHVDIIRSVNFQPISLTGRVTKAERQKYRITIPGAIKLIEEQTNGFITKDDWYPVPTEALVAEFAAILTGKGPYTTFSSHFACGASTYLLRDGDKAIKLGDFIDIDGMLEYMREVLEETGGKKVGLFKRLRIAAKLFSFVEPSKQPSYLNMKKILKNVLTKPSYEALGEFHTKSLFVGMMHFMDMYNYDIERVERCVIHYALPDGRIVPFCAFNIFPEIYRDKVQEIYAYSWEEWLRKHPGYDMSKEKYIRTEDFKKKVEASEEYRKTYVDIVNFW